MKCALSIGRGMKWLPPGTNPEVTGFVLSDCCQGRPCACTLRILQKVCPLPTPPPCLGIWGACGLPSTHTCVQGTHQLHMQTPACTRSRRELSESGHPCFLCTLLRSVFMLYPVPPSQTDGYRPLPVKLSGPLTAD